MTPPNFWAASSHECRARRPCANVNILRPVSSGPQYCIEHCLAITRTEHVVPFLRSLPSLLCYAQILTVRATWVRAVNIIIVQDTFRSVRKWLALHIFSRGRTESDSVSIKTVSAVLVSSASSSEGYEYGTSVTAAVCSLSNTESQKQRHWLSRR